MNKLGRLRKSLRAFVSAQDGVAAIEMAVLTPVIVTLLVCTADLGLGFYRKMQVQNAAQAGAAFAARHGFNAQAVTNVITGAAPSFPISASPSPRQFCGCPVAGNISPVSCTATCAGGTAAGTYVEASAQGIYNTLIPYPLMDAAFTFTAQSTVRLQ